MKSISQNQDMRYGRIPVKATAYFCQTDKNSEAIKREKKKIKIIRNE